MRIRWRGEGEEGRDDYMMAREAKRELSEKGILLRIEVVVSLPTGPWKDCRPSTISSTMVIEECLVQLSGTIIHWAHKHPEPDTGRNE